LTYQSGSNIIAVTVIRYGEEGVNMILIPEIETVLILVPRTGTGSLRRAVLQRYPRAMLIYRHMEADFAVRLNAIIEEKD
jgi:hypothetical protein